MVHGFMLGRSIAVAAILAVPAPSVRTTIVATAGPAPGTTTIIVRAQPVELTLGAYEGALRFAPTALSIVSVSVSPTEGSRFVNAADSAKGIVKFAGFAVSGFTHFDVVTLVVRLRGPIDAARLTANLTVAADPLGVAVPSDRLIASPDVRSPSSR